MYTQAQRDYYNRNRSTVIRKAKEHKKKLAERMYEFKKTLSCERCGFNTHPAAIQFHHRDPSTKLFNIGDMKANGTSWERLMAEVEKCEVLCANCHAIEHAGVV